MRLGGRDSGRSPAVCGQKEIGASEGGRLTIGETFFPFLAVGA
jgi:hypothetical protein